MDLNQLRQALLAQQQSLQQPQYNQAQVLGMMDEAELLRQQAANRRAIPPPAYGGSGALNAATSLSNNMRASRDEQRVLEQLKQAYAAQSGIDQYAAQAQALQAQMQKLQDEQIARDRFEKQEAIKQANAIALAEKKAGLKPGPKPEKPPTPVRSTLLNEDGSASEWLIDPMTGEKIKEIGPSKAAPTKDTEMSGKDTDIQEALGVLDNAEALLNNKTGFSGTGPIQGHVMQFSEWNQRFDAEAQHLFAVAKRIYKTKGEGQFSDADARALQGMLFSKDRDEPVNMAIIESLRKSLASRSPNFKDFVTDVQPLLSGQESGEQAQQKSAYERWKEEQGLP